MRRNFFIGIFPPKEMIENIIHFKNSLSEFSVKWTKDEDIHFTLYRFHSVNNKRIEEILSCLNEISEEIEPFNILIENISYWPLIPERPKMIWANIKKSKSIDLIKRRINNSDSLDNNSYPHITLGRVSGLMFRNIEPEETPVIDETINLSFRVRSLVLMEEKLKYNKFIKEFKI